MSQTQTTSFVFDHCAHQVPDIAAAVAWYQRHLPGVRVLYQDDSWAFLETGGAKLALILAGKHPDHIGFRVSDVELERLATEHGRSIRTHRDKTRSFYLEAPGGRWVEFISYPPDSIYG
ncbi:MAG: VOC family protein [Phycisphaerales bacterium]|nr:VOC family protein [Phycisphaerales bacterium]